MATAQFSLIVVETGGRKRCINGYAPDASNSLCRFDETKIAVSGSPDGYIAKPGRNSAVVDIVFTSDVATPTACQSSVNGVPTGDIFDVTAMLASVVTRPSCTIPLAPGDKFQLTML